MKLLLAGLMTLGALGISGGAMAKSAITNPPTAEQKADFYKACTVRGTAELCTCKADAAMKLIDTDFMAVVIASMKDKPTPKEDTLAYDKYIAASTKACGMGM